MDYQQYITLESEYDKMKFVEIYSFTDFMKTMGHTFQKQKKKIRNWITGSEVRFCEVIVKQATRPSQ